MSISLKGKEYSTYSEVLKEAHIRGLISIKTEMIMNPFENSEARAVFKATVILRVEDKNGEPIDMEFDGYGDATPKNVSGGIAPHLLRMAETRAKGRALRDAVNAKTLIEELNE